MSRPTAAVKPENKQCVLVAKYGFALPFYRLWH